MEANNTDFTNRDFPILSLLGQHWPRTMDEFVEGWFAHAAAPADARYEWVTAAEFDLARRQPRLAWEYIERVHAQGLTEEQAALLAAGPLEHLLAGHGDGLIDEVEAKARQDPSFQALLAGVWQNAMSDELWIRVQAAVGGRRGRN